MILGAALLTLLAGATADENPDEHRFVPVGVPTATFNSDEGFGFGVTGSLFHYHGGKKPFRDDLSAIVFITTRLVQRYELRWEGIDAFDSPLRVWARGGYFSTVTQNFCGFGASLPCDPGLADLDARRAGLRVGSEAYDEFVRRYYLMRYLRIHVDLNARWKLKDGRHKVELLGGYRGAYFIPGQVGDLAPYEGSLYAKVFPNGEPGFLSAPFVGVVFDGRDNEPAPNRGYFVEGSVRGSHPFIGSAWSHAGFNFSGAVFVSLLKKPRLVLATRVLVDLIGGDAPVDELASTGGTRVRPAFGGLWIGRGVRQQRYNGKIKLVSQSELRTGFYSETFFGLELGIGAAFFVDAGFIGSDWDDLGGFVPGQPSAASPRLVVTYGGGLRINFNQSFVIRVDVGFSADEAYPGLYMPVGNAF